VEERDIAEQQELTNEGKFPCHFLGYIKLNFRVRTPLSTPLDVLLNENFKSQWASCGANYTAFISSISLSKDAWAIWFFWHGAAVHQKVLQYPVKLDNEGRVNA